MEALFDPTVTSSFAATNRPSLFELLAQDQLRSLLQPAARYLLATLALHYPRYLIPLSNRHEETYSLALFFIERYHLLTHSASFSEHFYGLRRRAVLPLSTPRLDAYEAEGFSSRRRRTLSSKQHWGSLVALVFLPYLRLKAHDLFLTLGGLSDSSIIGPSSSTISSSTADGSPLPHPSRRARAQALLKRLFIKLYPWLNLSWELASLGWNVSYLFDKNRYWGVEGWILRLVMGRVEKEDLPIPPHVKSHPFSVEAIYSSLPSLLPTLLLSLKFLEFYNSPTSPFSLLSPSLASSSSASAQALQQPLLPPPPIPSPSLKGQNLLLRKAELRAWDECPLCRDSWRGRTPCVDGRRGGTVFCWGCVWDWLGKEEDEKGEGNGTCPVSGNEMRREDLRKLLI